MKLGKPTSFSQYVIEPLDIRYLGTYTHFNVVNTEYQL